MNGSPEDNENYPSAQVPDHKINATNNKLILP